MKKRPAGRPTLYDPKYCQEIIDFFNREPYSIAKDEDGNVLMDRFNSPIMTPARFPTFEMFALSIGVHRETLRNWCDANPEFFAAYKKAQDYQKEILIQNGLMGNYEKTFAIFTAKNVTDMRDKQEIDHSSQDGSMTPKPVIDATQLSDESLAEIMALRNAKRK